MPNTFADYLTNNFTPPSSVLGGPPTRMQLIQQRLAMMGRPIAAGAMDAGGGNGFVPGIIGGAKFNNAVPGLPPASVTPVTPTRRRPVGRPSGGTPTLGRIRRREQLPLYLQPNPMIPSRDPLAGQMPLPLPGSPLRGGGRRPAPGYGGPLPEDGGYGGQPVYPKYPGLPPFGLRR